MRCKECGTCIKRPSSGSKVLANMQGFFVCGECRNQKTGKKYCRLGGVTNQ